MSRPGSEARKVLLFHVDGKLPNVALMKIAAHHRMLGDTVETRYATSVEKVDRSFLDKPDLVYASLIFEKSRPIARRILDIYPNAVLGGTGWDEMRTLQSVGIETLAQDYTDYPKWPQSIGFTQRGCRYKCSFCKVPRAEPKMRKENSVPGLWRGEPWPRELILLDNDFFGEPDWPERIAEIRDGKFKVCFSQGINARALSGDAAAAIASVDYRDDSMKSRRIYTAWDNRKDERKLFAGLRKLTSNGVTPDQIMVYVLIGYDHEIKSARPYLVGDDFHRMTRLREFGARPYPMPYTRESRELVAFQWWAMGGRHKKIRWSDMVAAGFRPERLEGRPALGQRTFFAAFNAEGESTDGQD